MESFFDFASCSLFTNETFIEVRNVFAGIFLYLMEQNKDIQLFQGEKI